MALRFAFNGVTSDEYPESSTQIKYGRGYQFATKPRGPDQITTKVSFPKGLFWFENINSRLMDNTAVPAMNVGALMVFYEAVRMYDVFEYVHPIRGLTNYRFAKPLTIPPIVDDPNAIGGYAGFRVHQVAPFDVSLILQP